MTAIKAAAFSPDQQNGNTRIPRWLFPVGVLICLLQVWLPAYYLTGDGPCHLYNAQIVHDLWRDKHILYNDFYFLVYQPNPNWFATFVMASLLFVVKGVLAEKIFLSLYILSFTLGFYLLLRKINDRNPWWLLAVFMFVFSHSLAKGFYNYSFSIAYFFWMVWSWLRFMERPGVLRGLAFLVFTLCIFFTHLLPFVFGAFTCGALVVSHAIADDELTTSKSKWRFAARYLGALLAFCVPFLIIANWFTDKEGGLKLEIGHHFYRLVELAQFKYIVNQSMSERPMALIAGVLLMVLATISSVLFLIRRSIHKYDGFLAALIFVMFVYLFFPEDFLGRAILINMRAQLFVHILGACCIAYRFPWERVRNAAGGVLFACFLLLFVIRLGVQLRASPAAADYLSASRYIAPNSVVLPVDLAPDGHDELGRAIADWNYLFCHVPEYMASEKPMVFMDNYEANAGYFPISWRGEKNPYLHLGVKPQGVEGLPPATDMAHYKEKTGVTVDYITIWCFNDTFLRNDAFRKMYADIQAEYHPIYKSPSGRTILYKKN